MNKKDKHNDVDLDMDDVELEDINEEDSTSSKIKSLKKQLSDAKKEKSDILTEFQKAKADFVNMRRRDEVANKDLIKYAKQGVIEDLLPVLDSFDMAFSNKEAWEKAPQEWRVGVEYIYNQLLSIVEQNGVMAVSPIGQKFDPNKHEALESVKVSDESQDGKIVAVVQKGYIMGDRLIRPAKVKVGEK